MNKHQYESAIFLGDKLLHLTSSAYTDPLLTTRKMILNV